ncbi:RHS repeat protein [Hahella sp. HN01]|nr:RHS repeat protein [Hahella sp. HN01]
MDGNLTRLDNSADISKQYHYEDSRFPHALTGITDEKGVRFATWKYDDQGRAVLSEHADGAERVTLSFNSDGSTTVTNELGKQTTYHFTHLYGTNKPTSVEGHASENCIAANSSYTYDQYGYKDLVTDWKGNITDFDYSPTGLEIKRVEAKGTSDERITVTEWNPTLRQPIKITEPDRITEFVYDDNGKLKSKSILPVEIQ